MSRTLEPGVSLLTAAEIRVVVVPIGPVPRDTFEGYLEALNAHRHVPLAATAAFHHLGSKSPFQHLAYKTGALHFRFMQADDARRRSRVADLHVQRCIVAVLGLLHLPLVEDLASAHAEFVRTARQWPEALVARCVAFQPSPSHLASPAAKLPDLMIFPEGHLAAHMEPYSHEFAAAVLGAMEEHVLGASVSAIKLNTYVDSGEFLGSLAQIEEGLRKLNINEEEVKEKKRWGRLQKAKGDWSLLAGSPRDAFEHYKSGMELSRVAGDAIWYGAAVEGLAHARVLEALMAARPAAGSDKAGGLNGKGSGSSLPPAAEGAGAGDTAPEEQQPDASASPSATAKHKSSSSSVSSVSPFYALSGPAVCRMLAAAELEGEVRELLAEARSWYKKKGGALPLQIEQSVKLCRFVAAAAAGAASSSNSSGNSSSGEALQRALKAEVDAAVGLIMESLPSLSLLEDRAIALAEAGQLLGLAGCGRMRLLLLWAALDLLRSGGSGPAAVAAGAGVPSGVLELGPAPPAAAVDVGGLLKLALLAMEPPEQPGQKDPDDAAKVHWAMKCFIGWQQQQQQQLQQATSQQPAQQQPHAAPGGGSDSSGSAAAEAAAAGGGGSNQQASGLQQQFQQLLGPHLQLLTAAQAAALEAPCLGQLPQHRQPPGSPSKTGSSHTQQQDQGQLASLVGGASDGLLHHGQPQQWESLQVALLEVLSSVARVANAPVEAWEAAAALLREHYPLLPQALQAGLLDSLATAGAAMGTRLRLRPGPGPGPQVQLKRVLPGPACLQPQHLSGPLPPDAQAAAGGPGGLRRSEGPAGSAGPFIFNPYAVKRAGASAAAAAEAALPEWVCGEEGRVELLLVNPCAAPLKLDGLQLQVQPLPLPGAQQQGAAASSDLQRQQSSSTADERQQQQQRSVSVMLAAGSKPTRVVLTYTPSRPGCVAITGIQASAKGTSWFQPLVQLPALPGTPGAAAVASAAAAAARERVKPQGCFTVVVQPQLPLLKACLQGAEVQLIEPPEEDLTGLSGPAAAASSSSSAPAAQAGGWGHTAAAALYTSPAAAAAAAGSPRAAGGDLDKKAAAVVVFEGQTLCWTLTLTNISAQPVTGCKVTVHNAKGAVLRAPPAAASTNAPAASSSSSSGGGAPQLVPPPPSLSGAFMDVQEQGLASGLPLAPGASLALPVSLTVGKPPGGLFEALTLQLRVTYHGTASSTASGSSTEAKLLGRCLAVPVRLSIQPTIQVKSLRFLQQGLPLRNGSRDDIILSTPQRLLLQSLRDSRDAAGAAGLAAGASSGSSGAAAGGSPLKRTTSHHVRNSSEGALPVPLLGAPIAPLVKEPQPSAAAGSSSCEPAQPVRALSPVRQAGTGSTTSAAATATAAAAAGGSLAVASQPVLELVVRNASERYFRTWLGCLPGKLSADKALSAVAVLEPGDTQKLAAVVPDAPAGSSLEGSEAAGAEAGAAAHAGSTSGLKEPPRLAAAELLVGRLVVCWEMITGSASAGVLPRGCVPLEPLDVAANLTPVALACLCPAALHLRLSVPAAAAAPGTQAPPHMVDLSAAAALSGSSGNSAAGSFKLPGLTGPLWGMHMKVGQWLAVDLEVSWHACTARQEPLQQLQASLFVVDALSTTAALAGHPGTPTAAAAALDKGGSHAAAMLLGSTFVARSSGGVAGTPTAADATAAAAAAGQLVDAGVFLTGCYSRLQVAVAPGSRGQTHRLQALLVQPGLYVFGVAGVQPVSAPAHSGSETPAGQQTATAEKAAGRVFFSQDRLYVLAST